MSLLKACAGLNCAPAADQLDLRNKQLIFVPDFIYRQRRTLRELFLDYNQIKDLPPLLFQQMVSLRVLTLSENDLIKLPCQIANLDKLVELDISKNGLIDLPDNLQYCHSLRTLDVSCNPFVRTPDCVGRIRTLTKCCLNDTNLERMPNEIGSLANLQVLEARENILTNLPESIGSLSKLVQLDLGGNEIEYLPASIGQLSLLQELWLDSNLLLELPPEISHLSRLECLDVSKNKLDALPENINLLQNLADLHLSENCIHWLPPGIGHLKKLTLLKMDMNRLQTLPDSLEHLVELREFVASENSIEVAPAALFELPNLEVLYLDQNRLQCLPTSFGKTPSLRILSFRSNDLTEIPESVQLLTELKVLDLRNNKLRFLPAGMTELDLSALWIGESQVHPVMKLERETDQGVTTCQHHFLPQNKDISRLGLPISDPEFDNHMTESLDSREDTEITFEDGPAPSGKSITRIKTPRYPAQKKIQQSALRALEAVEGGEKRRVKFESQVTEAHFEYDSGAGQKKRFSFFRKGKKERKRSKRGRDQLPEEGESRIAVIKYTEEASRPETEIKSTPTEIPSTPDLLRIPKFIEEEIVVDREGYEELGFSFWGDTDYAKEGIFVKTISQGSAADRDGRLRPGDQILEVDGKSLENLSKQEVAELLMSTRGAVRFRIHRVTSSEHPNSPKQEINDQLILPARDDSPPLSSDQLSSSEDESDTEYLVEEALLVKSGKLGMSIVGGGNISSAPFGQGRPGIYISKIVPGGSADRTRVLRVGDRILEVNNQNLRKAAHITAVECFTKSGNEITISVRHVPPPVGLQEVSLIKKEAESYGLVIRDDNGPVSSSTMDTDVETVDTNRGIFISAIQEGSAAAIPGKLRPGQRILEVNGRSLIGLQYREAVSILSKCNTSMVLIVCEGDGISDNASDEEQLDQLKDKQEASEGASEVPGQRQAWREMMASKMSNQTRHMEDLIKRLQDLEENLKIEVPPVPLSTDDPSYDPTN